MNHVWTTAWRSTCFNTSKVAWNTERPSLRQAYSLLAYTRQSLQQSPAFQPSKRAAPRLGPIASEKRCLLSRSFSSSVTNEFSKSHLFSKLRPYVGSRSIDQGLAFRPTDLSRHELAAVFSQEVNPPELANRLLRIVYSRMVDGTPDLDLPLELKRRLKGRPLAVDEAIQWLRQNHPVDEDEAILRRIDREDSAAEQENPSDLIGQGENLGLYTPQSGSYGAKLGKEGDIYGDSEIDRIRAANLEKYEHEEKELEDKLNQVQKDVEEKFGQLQVKNENSLEVSTGPRPPNSFEKWVFKNKNLATSKLDLDSPEIAGMSKTRRLLPSFIFVSVVSALCYFVAETWVPPVRAHRLWPELTLSVATILAIVSVNIGVRFLWRFPPAWSFLNKYAMNLPATPRASSMLGNTFSHQSWPHLVINMALTAITGFALHEDVGRGTFIGLYLASGAIGSFASLTSFTLKNVLITSSLGASGSVAGIIGMYFTIHANDRLTLPIPDEWQKNINIKGWMFLSIILPFQVVGFLSPIKTIDYACHLGGYATGMVCGWWWRENRKKERTALAQQKKELSWYDKMWAVERDMAIHLQGDRQ